MQHIFTNADQEVVEFDGSPLRWRVSAYALIVKDGKLLIHKNRTEKVYDIPGGGIEMEEDVNTALHREAMEEIGAQIQIGQLVDVVEGWFSHKNGVFYHTIQLGASHQ